MGNSIGLMVAGRVVVLSSLQRPKHISTHPNKRHLPVGVGFGVHNTRGIIESSMTRPGTLDANDMSSTIGVIHIGY
jgi:hypothetical protein